MKRLILSDIHFGTKNISSLKAMISNFLLENEDELKDLDYLIISGDYHDGLLEYNSTDAIESMETLFIISNFCITHDIKFRVLEGTDSHDRKQLEMFSKLVKQERTLQGLDFIYITDITILHETDHTCLYIPDNIRDNIIQTSMDALELVRELPTGKVDQCIMHGAFKHSLGFGDETTLFDEKFMLNLCSGFIVAGHIHTHQVFSRILTPGSFTRLKFGQEEDKGALLLDGESFRFIINNHTDIFYTIKVFSTTPDEFFMEVVPKLISLPVGANVKIVASHDNLIFTDINREALREDLRILFEYDKKKEDDSFIDEDDDIFNLDIVDNQLRLDANIIAKYVEKNINTIDGIQINDVLKEIGV